MPRVLLSCWLACKFTRQNTGPDFSLRIFTPPHLSCQSLKISDCSYYSSECCTRSVTQFQPLRTSTHSPAFQAIATIPTLSHNPQATQKTTESALNSASIIMAYIWTWLCCRARIGTTVYHHPGPYLVETTASCAECDHQKCERCETK